jgi:hypothetical protein
VATYCEKGSKWGIAVDSLLILADSEGVSFVLFVFFLPSEVFL